MTITVLNTGPVKLCRCGCLEPTRPHAETNARRGWIRGETHYDYIHGHHARGTNPETQRRRRQRVERVREFQRGGLTYRQIAPLMDTTHAALNSLMADPDGSKTRAAGARYRERHRAMVRYRARGKSKRCRDRKKVEKRLDGPRFVEWLASQAITAGRLDMKEPDNARRLRSWANGQNVRLTTADRFLTDHGHHLHQLPDSLWA